MCLVPDYWNRALTAACVDCTSDVRHSLRVDYENSKGNMNVKIVEYFVRLVSLTNTTEAGLIYILLNRISELNS